MVDDTDFFLSVISKNTLNLLTNSMKNLSFLRRALPLAVAAVGFVVLPNSAQAQIKHKVEVKKVEVSMQQTPNFAAAGPKSKRWDPLDWLEIEVELKVETIEKNKIIPELNATFYVALPNVSGGPGADKVMLTDRITFTNVRTHSGEAYLIAYVSPDTLSRFTGKEKASDSDIFSAGIEIDGPGVRNTEPKDLVGATKEVGWWRQVSYPREQGMVLRKGKTPFALLWFDRYPVARDDR